MPNGERPNHYSEQLREAIAKLPRSSYIGRQLGVDNATWVSKPSGVPIDLAFIYKAGRGSSNGFMMSRFAGISLCGERDVIGVAIVKNEEEKLAREAAIAGHEELSYVMKETRAKVVYVDEEKFLKWTSFYDRLDQIDAERGRPLIDILGARAGELAGFTPATEDDYVQTRYEMEQLLENEKERLVNAKVKAVPDYYGIDLAFVDKKENPSPLPFCQVRLGVEWDGLLVERVVDRMENVVGLMYRQPGEDKRHHYARVARLEEEINEDWGTEDNPYRILPVSSGTTKLWRKVGVFEHPQGILPEVSGTVLRAFRTLFWGTDTLHPGPLAVLGYSMPGTGDALRFERLDGVFLKRDKRGRSVYASVDGLVAVRKEKLVELSNVAGFVAFPDDMPFEDREKWVKPAATDFNKRTGIIGRKIWHIDNHLLDVIEKNGTPFYDGEDRSGTPISAGKAIKYFRKLKENGGSRELWMRWFRAEPQIGANKHVLELETDKTIYGQWLDYGYSFKADTPSVLKKIGRLPPTHDGLRRLLGYGDLVARPGIHEIWYLIATARNWPGLASRAVLESDPIAKYLVAELGNRLSREEIMDKFPREIGVSIVRHGMKLYREIFGQKEQVVTGITPTHWHLDHIGGLAYVDKSIPQIWSGPMWAAALGATLRAGSWRQRYTVSTDINAPQRGNIPYPVEDRDIQIYWKSGMKQRLTPFSNQTAYMVDHSVPASWLITEVDMGHGQMYRLFNSGDWRWGKNTENALNMIQNSGVKVDAIVQEGTRLSRAEAKWQIIGDEEQVKDSFAKYLVDNKGLKIVAVSPRSYERLHNLVEVALSKGFNVALSDNHAVDTLQYAAVREMAPMDAEGFEWVLPHVLGEERVTVWAREMTRPRSHHGAVRGIASFGELGLLTPQRLSAKHESSRWVVFVSPFEVLEDQFGAIDLTDGVSMFWSAPMVYEDDTKDFWNMNKRWLTGAPFHGRWYADFEVNGRHVTMVKDKYGLKHASGHANSKQIFEVLDTLIGSDRKNVDLYLVHTDRPEAAEQMIERRFGRRVKVTSIFPRYDPKKPFEKSGARFKLA